MRTPKETGSDMDPSNSPVCCQAGETQCQYLEELERLRKENKALEQLVHTDTLTGIHNYRFLIQSLEVEIERTQRSQQPTTLIMVDLDYFKQVNDQWGHDIGNEALKQTATLIRQAVRILDIPCRYGGEEFSIILPSTHLLVGVQVAERIRRKIQKTPLISGELEINLTASFGVDAYSLDDNDTPESFIKRADQYLYQAKNNGRNCVAHATVKGPTHHDRKHSAVSQSEKEALFKAKNTDKTN